MIYLDNAATTYPKPEDIYSAMDKFAREGCVNAGRGSYKLAIKASEIVDETRILLLNLINSSLDNKVIFTPSATLAINQVLRGLNWKNIKNVYVSPFEHNAIMRTLHSISKTYKFNINIIPFDNISFEMNEEELKVKFARENPDLIIMSHVSNTTGLILPIGKCSDIALNYNPIIIIDCAQSLGSVPVDIKGEFSECDFIIFAGHKSLYGPFGIGGFICLNRNIELSEILTGGTGVDSTNLEMPKKDISRYEPGSYNVNAISGLNAALKWIRNTTIEKIYEHEKILSSQLISGLKDIEGIELYIPGNLEKHIGIVAFNLRGYNAYDVGKIIDEEYGVCVRTGHHCAPLVGQFLDGYAIRGTVRASVGYFNTKDEISRVIFQLKNI